jgi:hypothetical protein
VHSTAQPLAARAAAAAAPMPWFAPVTIAVWCLPADSILTMLDRPVRPGAGAG